MAEPVSWLLIRPGWKVLAADGSEAGAVDEVVGNERMDIFGGLSFSASALGKPRYVPAERVAAIEEGAVRLSLAPAEIERLADRFEPPAAARREGPVERVALVVRRLLRR